MSLQDVLDFALAQRGKPYIWGGTGPGGYDCSGLVEKAFAAGGVTLPRTSQEQRNAGTAVPLGQIAPGDLVTFTYNDGPSNPGPGNHVALYLGQGQVVEAARPGVPIRVAPLDTAHVDRVRRVLGGNASAGVQQASATSTTGSGGSSPATLQQAGYDAVLDLTPFGIPLNPFKLPGWLWSKVQGGLNDAAGSGLASLSDALGPVLLAGVGVVAGAGLVVLGLYVTAKPTIDSGLETVGKISAVK